jgi:hypothetical protein
MGEHDLVPSINPSTPCPSRKSFIWHRQNNFEIVVGKFDGEYMISVAQ